MHILHSKSISYRLVLTAFISCFCIEVTWLPLSKAIDGDSHTSFIYRDKGVGWVGIDLVKFVSIEKFTYCPHKNANFICPGDTYELFYASKHNWTPIASMTATANSMYMYNPLAIKETKEKRGRTLSHSSKSGTITPAPNSPYRKEATNVQVIERKTKRFAVFRLWFALAAS